MNEIVETPLPNKNESQMVVVALRPLPKILENKIKEGNERLRQIQQQTQSEVEEATIEVMELMGISREDGWFLDLDGMRFVQIAPESTSGNEDDVDDSKVVDEENSIED